MPEPIIPDDAFLDYALRDGLEQLPRPEPGDDFNRFVVHSLPRRFNLRMAVVNWRRGGGRHATDYPTLRPLRWNPWLHRAALLALAALLVMPGSREIFRSHLNSISGRGVLAGLQPTAVISYGLDPGAARRGADYAARHPHDTALQAVRQLQMPESPADAQQLVKTYPNDPAVLAIVLRQHYCGQLDARLPRRLAAKEAVPEAQRKEDEKKTQANRQAAAQVAALADAAQAADPGNGYFAFMKAAAEFGWGHEDRACAEVLRAASMPRWNDYSYEELSAAIRLRDVATGNQHARNVMYCEDMVFGADYHRVYQVAVLISTIAREMSARGQTEQSLRLRQALVRAAERWRNQARTQYSLELCGQVMLTAVTLPTSTSITENGPIPPGTHRRAWSAAEGTSWQFVFGRPGTADAAWADRVWDAAKKLSLDAGTSEDRRNAVDSYALYGAWSASLELLGNMVLLLGLAVFAGFASRTATVRLYRRTTFTARVAAASCVAALMALFPSWSGLPGNMWGHVTVALVAAGLLLGALLWTRWGWRAASAFGVGLAASVAAEWGHGLSVASVWGPYLLAGSFVAALPYGRPGPAWLRSAAAAMRYVTLLLLCAGLCIGFVAYSVQTELTMMTYAFGEPNSPAMDTLTPALLCLALIAAGVVVSLARRAPLWAGTVRFVRVTALPCAFLVFVAYAASATYLARMDTDARQKLLQAGIFPAGQLPRRALPGYLPPQPPNPVIQMAPPSSTNGSVPASVAQ